MLSHQNHKMSKNAGLADFPSQKVVRSHIKTYQLFQFVFMKVPIEHPT